MTSLLFTFPQRKWSLGIIAQKGNDSNQIVANSVKNRIGDKCPQTVFMTSTVCSSTNINDFNVMRLVTWTSGKNDTFTISSFSKVAI